MGGGEQSANSGTVDGCSSGSQINNSEETFLQQNCKTNKPGSNQQRQSFSTGLNIGTEHRPVQGCWADAVWRTDWHKRTHTHTYYTQTHTSSTQTHLPSLLTRAVSHPRHHCVRFEQFHSICFVCYSLCFFPVIDLRLKERMLTFLLPDWGQASLYTGSCVIRRHYYLFFLIYFFYKMHL